MFASLQGKSGINAKSRLYVFLGWTALQEKTWLLDCWHPSQNGLLVTGANATENGGGGDRDDDDDDDYVDGNVDGDDSENIGDDDVMIMATIRGRDLDDGHVPEQWTV